MVTQELYLLCPRKEAFDIFTEALKGYTFEIMSRLNFSYGRQNIISIKYSFSLS